MPDDPCPDARPRPGDRAESERSLDRALHAECSVWMRVRHSVSQRLRLLGRGRSASVPLSCCSELGVIPTSRYFPSDEGYLHASGAAVRRGSAGSRGAFGRPLRSSIGVFRAVLPGRIAVAQIRLQQKWTHAHMHTHTLTGVYANTQVRVWESMRPELS